jgi:hypothetical protein
LLDMYEETGGNYEHWTTPPRTLPGTRTYP